MNFIYKFPTFLSIKQHRSFKIDKSSIAHSFPSCVRNIRNRKSVEFYYSYTIKKDRNHSFYSFDMSSKFQGHISVSRTIPVFFIFPTYTWCWCKYFSLVAIPPRMCRSDLLTSNTTLVFTANAGLICFRRSVTSLCTVDLLIPYFFAACRTVALLSMIYRAISIARSSI